MRSPLECLAPQDCLCFPPDEGCVCCDTEKVLRWIGYRLVGHGDRPPLTHEQREWCLTEIGLGGEYGYRRKDYENLPDADLCKGVLQVMVEYCRDKGLLR